MPAGVAVKTGFLLDRKINCCKNTERLLREVTTLEHSSPNSMANF